MSTVYDNQPTLADVRAYLGAGDTHTDDEVSSALAAETAAQLNGLALPCAYDADTDTTTITYPADVAEALKRRVARNLAMRGLPLSLATTVADGDLTPTRIFGNDSEVQRLERPYRRMAVR